MATIALSACSAISAGAASSGAQIERREPSRVQRSPRAPARRRALVLGTFARGRACGPRRALLRDRRLAPPWHRHAGVRALESRVAIARIGDERLALGGKCRGQPRLWNAEQRAQQAGNNRVRGPPTSRRGRRSPLLRGAADQVGLGLIFAVMRGQQMQAAMLAAPFGEQAIAGLARRLLNAGRRLFPSQTRTSCRIAARRQPAAEPARSRRRSPAAAGGRRSARRPRRGASAPSDRPESRARGCRGRPRRRPRQTGRSRNRRDGRARRQARRRTAVARRLPGSAPEPLLLLRRPLFDGAARVREMRGRVASARCRHCAFGWRVRATCRASADRQAPSAPSDSAGIPRRRPPPPQSICRAHNSFRPANTARCRPTDPWDAAG